MPQSGRTRFGYSPHVLAGECPTWGAEGWGELAELRGGERQSSEACVCGGRAGWDPRGLWGWECKLLPWARLAVTLDTQDWLVA